MGFKVKFSHQAAQDLSDIIRYISDTLINPPAAVHFYDCVSQKLDTISQNPRIYPLSRDKSLSSQGYRAAVIGNYLMFYLVNDESETINIARVIYGKRDFTGIDFQ